MIDRAKFVEVSAGVRYWEDATVSGQEDSDGELIPLRNGQRWEPVICLETGLVQDWPTGTAADVHYKVCDDGEYWLLDEQKNRIAHQDGYVLDMLSVGDNGYGDYIILAIGEDGLIRGWQQPSLESDQWEILPDTDKPSLDAARLDWLESQINEHGQINLHDGSNPVYGALGLGLRPGSIQRTLREAIDAAMGDQQ